MLLDLTFPRYLTTFSGKKCLSGKVICAIFCPAYRSSPVLAFAFAARTVLFFDFTPKFLIFRRAMVKFHHRLCELGDLSDSTSSVHTAVGGQYCPRPGVQSACPYCRNLRYSTHGYHGEEGPAGLPPTILPLVMGAHRSYLAPFASAKAHIEEEYCTYEPAELVQ
jgi:hypothetical protein